MISWSVTLLFDVFRVFNNSKVVIIVTASADRKNTFELIPRLRKVPIRNPLQTTRCAMFFGIPQPIMMTIAYSTRPLAARATPPLQYLFSLHPALSSTQLMQPLRPNSLSSLKHLAISFFLSVRGRQHQTPRTLLRTSPLATEDTR